MDPLPKSVGSSSATRRLLPILLNTNTIGKSNRCNNNMARREMRVMSSILISKYRYSHLIFSILVKFMVKVLKMVNTPARRMSSNSQN